MNNRLPKFFAIAILVSLLLLIPAGVTAQTAQNAGKISAVLPIANVHRGPQQINATLSLPLDWGDVVNTGHLARVRVALNDGSVLNVGSDSNLTVTQHDAAAQQTELELNYGRVRARAVQLVKPNASFQIRTPTGVAGVVGTDFEMSYDNDTTHVIVFEGKVRFCSLVTEKKKDENEKAGPEEPAPSPSPDQEQDKQKKKRGLMIGPCVIVGAGAASSLRFNEAPSQPAPVTPMNLTTAMNSTSVSGAGGAAGGGAAGGGAAAGGAGAAGGGIGAAGGILAGVSAAVAATVATVVIRSVSKTSTCAPPPPTPTGGAAGSGRCAVLQKGGARPINGQRPH
jgi:hypothetical protein